MHGGSSQIQITRCTRMPHWAGTKQAVKFVEFGVFHANITCSALGAAAHEGLFARIAVRFVGASGPLAGRRADSTIGPSAM